MSKTSLARGHTKASDTKKTVIKLEANHEYSSSTTAETKSTIQTFAALSLYVPIIGGVHILTGAYLLVKLRGSNTEALIKNWLVDRVDGLSPKKATG